MVFYITGGAGFQPSTVCKAYVYWSFPTPKIAENKVQDSCIFAETFWWPTGTSLNDADVIHQVALLLCNLTCHRAIYLQSKITRLCSWVFFWETKIWTTRPCWCVKPAKIGGNKLISCSELDASFFSSGKQKHQRSDQKLRCGEENSWKHLYILLDVLCLISLGILSVQLQINWRFYPGTLEWYPNPV